MAQLKRRAVVKVRSPASITHLAELTTDRLKGLLLALGGPQTGTKKILLENVRSALLTPKVRLQLQKPTRILSIDMGIRNLAFCVLDAEVGIARKAGKTRTLTDLDEHNLYRDIPHVCTRIAIVAWKRLSLLDAFRTAGLSQSSIAGTRLPDANEEEADAGHSKSLRRRSRTKDNKPASPQQGEDAEPQDQKVDYSPSVMAQVAYKLVSEVFLPLNISHIVIERQRHRSGGASAVLEWTIRVNRLESMLHAIFETLRRTRGGRVVKTDHKHSTELTQDSENEHGPSENTIFSVTSVDPKAVNRLWLETSLAQLPHLVLDDRITSTSENKSLNASANLKRRKIEIAEGLIAGKFAVGEMAFNEQALAARRRFLEASDQLTSRQRTKRDMVKTAPEDKKRDDLADCLLQGLAWVQWELSRRTLAPVLLQDKTTGDAQSVQESPVPAVLDLPELWPKYEA